MRTHGWGGRVPVNDDEAVARILEATRACIDERGAATGLADVARALGVTRQTVYRYFAGTEALLTATAVDAVGAFLERLATRLDGIAEPDRAVVIGVMSVLDELSKDRYVGLLLSGENLSLPVVGGFTSDVGRDFARTMVDRLDVDWTGRGYDAAAVDRVVEMVLRTLQSMVLDPGAYESSQQRAEFVDAWLGAAVRALSAVNR